jgi:hypothetical protein
MAIKSKSSKPSITPPPAPTGSIGVGGLTDAGSVQQALSTPSSAAYGFWHQDDGKQIDASRPAWQQTMSGFLQEAKAQGWLYNANSFQQNFKQTDWYKSNGAQGVLAASTKFNNPTQWATDVANRSQQIKSAASKLGYSNLDEATLNDIAEKSLFSAYDANAFDNPGYQSLLQSKIANSAVASKAIPTGGVAVDNINQLKQYSQSMGIANPDQWYQNAANQINDPKSGLTLNDFKTQIKDNAKLNWSGYSDKIDKGFAVSDIVSPYIQSMSRILEIDPNAVDISTDPYIKKAAGLTVGPDGTSQPMPTWQFENLLRQDPKWLQTNNARDSLMSSGLSLLKSFGLAN